MSYVGWLDDSAPSLTLHAAAARVTEHGGSGSRLVGTDIFEVLADYAGRLPSGGSQAGWVGFFGYAARLDLPAQLDPNPDVVDACWMRANRFVAFDHQRRRVHAVSPPDHAEAWRSEVSALLASTTRAVAPAAEIAVARIVSSCAPEQFAVAFDEVQAQLRLGNSYETNLTFRIVAKSAADPVDVYRRLRRLNPAPYAALITHHGTSLLSSSPERFATVDAAGLIETRPIKGTTPRDSDPAKDEAAAARLRDEPKFVGENLMIVDLLRNDLSRVCDVGTVQVTDLMHVESYPSVHQLITTIGGHLRPEVSTLSALHALFPGGSMTGAPKLRTMSIIAEVESSPRGAYAGALGWILDDGSADLGITIRSLVHRDGRYELGTGGGITVRSRCEEELTETGWKVQTLLSALGLPAGSLQRWPLHSSDRAALQLAALTRTNPAAPPLS